MRVLSEMFVTRRLRKHKTVYSATTLHFDLLRIYCGFHVSDFFENVMTSFYIATFHLSLFSLYKCGCQLLLNE